jgi:hypothetical protein
MADSEIRTESDVVVRDSGGTGGEGRPALKGITVTNPGLGDHVGVIENVTPLSYEDDLDVMSLTTVRTLRIKFGAGSFLTWNDGDRKMKIKLLGGAGSGDHVDTTADEIGQVTLHATYPDGTATDISTLNSSKGQIKIHIKTT